MKYYDDAKLRLPAADPFPRQISNSNDPIARKAMKIRVFHPLNGFVITNMTLNGGAKFGLPQGPGAYILRGETTIRR